MEFERLRRNWENLGRKDPMWAILTQAGTDGGRWDEAEFMNSGIEFVEWIAAWLSQQGVTVQRGDALDFGCGIGRITQAMAPHFSSVTGVDVSQPMIDLANEKNRFGEQVRYLCNTRPDLSVIPDASLDLVVTAIVLQHMRAEYSLAYLREFLRILRPGGVLFFQLATGELGESGSSLAPAQEADEEAHMEIHCVPLEDVHDTLKRGGGELVFEEPDRWAGADWESAHFAVRRT